MDRASQLLPSLRAAVQGGDYAKAQTLLRELKVRWDERGGCAASGGAARACGALCIGAAANNNPQKHLPASRAAYPSPRRCS